MYTLSESPLIPRPIAASLGPAVERPQRLHVRALSALWMLVLAAGSAFADPFVVEDMPAGFDGAVIPGGAGESALHGGNTPVAVDFDGDGQTSWYAGGRQVAHPKAPNPIDPLRFANTALPAISLAVCPSCTPRYLAFAVADFNRDGNMDILRLNSWNGHSYEYTFQLFAGNGNNGFTLGSRVDWTYDIGAELGKLYFQLKAADFNGDGQQDLALLITAQYTNSDPDPWRNEGSLRIRLNDIGSFPTETVLQSRHFMDSSYLHVADMDRDADTDILVNSSSTWTPDNTYSFTTRLFRNNGSASFTASNDNSIVTPVGFGDVNRDHQEDYLFFGYSLGCGAIICVRLHDGSGSFDSAWYPYASFSGGDSPYAVAVADMDEDGRPDLLTAEDDIAGDSKRLTLHRGLTDTGTAAAETIATLPANIHQIAVGDARGDADNDLLLRLADGSFRFVRNTAQRLTPRGDGGFTVASLAGLSRLGVTDSNRDGIDDVFALQPNGARLHRALGNSVGTFNATEFKIIAGPATDFTLGDFNGDGLPDMAYVVPADGEVRTVTQIDNIYFSWTDTKIADYAGAALIEAGNVQIYDGSTDLFVGSNTSGGLRALRNVNDATSWSASTPRASYSVMPDSLVTVPRYGTLGDAVFACNSDDIVFAIEGYSVILGWARTARLIQVQTVPQTGMCATVNIDDDAEKELVFVSGDGRLISWSPANEDIVVSQTIDNVPSGVVNAISPVDWNRDGLDDLLVAASTGLHLYTREGLTESWTVRTLYNTAPAAILDVVAVDVNRDSRPDAAFLTSAGIRVVRNASAIVSATTSDTPSGSPLVLQPGQAGTAFTIDIANPGRFDEDARIAVTGTRVVFRKAVDNGGSFTQGATMTKTEVEQAVTSVSLLMNGLVIGTAGTTAVQADGSMAINYIAALGNAVPIAADALNTLTFRVTLKANAASASYSRFFLTHASGEPGTARVLRGATPTGRTGAFGYAAANLVHIVTAPPSVDLFKDSFETAP